jgi:hypothetical protein
MMIQTTVLGKRILAGLPEENDEGRISLQWAEKF